MGRGRISSKSRNTIGISNYRTDEVRFWRRNCCLFKVVPYFYRHSPSFHFLFRPGDIYFGDDVGSKGHHSENSGQGPVLLWQLQMKPDWKKSFENAGKTGPCWPSM